MKLLNFKRNTIGDYAYRHGLFVPVEDFFVESPLFPDQIFEFIAEGGRTLHSALHWELYCMAPL
jgi:hypothetical protein